MTSMCELPQDNPAPAQLADILRQAKVVAVVGLSDQPDRPSYQVAAYLQTHGYRIIPVNPHVSKVLGQKAWPSLRDVSEPIDVVDIFRRAEAVPSIVDEAIAVGAKVLWMQEGIVHNAAAARARAAGLRVVMNKCMLKEHRRI